MPREMKGYLETLAVLHARTVAFLAEDVQDLARVVSIQTVELSDGSGRLASLVTLEDDLQEAVWRIAAPAPADAPAWAQVHTTCEVEEVSAA